MHLIRAGKKIIGLEYLILAEEWDGSEDTAVLRPGDVRVTLVSGRVVNLRDDAARAFLRRVEDVLPQDDLPGETAGSAGTGLQAFDPETGQPLKRAGDDVARG